MAKNTHKNDPQKSNVEDVGNYYSRLYPRLDLMHPSDQGVPSIGPNAGPLINVQTD